MYNLTNETHSTSTVRRAILNFQLSRMFVIQKKDGTTITEYSLVTRLSQFHLGFHLLGPCESVAHSQKRPSTYWNEYRILTYYRKR